MEAINPMINISLHKVISTKKKNFVVRYERKLKRQKCKLHTPFTHFKFELTILTKIQINIIYGPQNIRNAFGLNKYFGFKKKGDIRITINKIMLRNNNRLKQNSIKSNVTVRCHKTIYARDAVT